MRITIDDVCQDIAENKNWYFCNGFYFDGTKNIISRRVLRDAIAFRYSRYNVDHIDKLEEVVCEHNQIKGIKPRKNFLNSIKPKKGNVWLLDYFNKTYPQYNWEQIFYDIIMHKSEHMYILYGVREAGKSALLDLLKIIFGEFAHEMTIEQLSNKFNLGEAVGNLFVVGDDLGKEDFGTSIGIIKSMATGNSVSVERKFMHSQRCIFEGNFVFACNKIPYFDISDDGVMRRVCVLQLDKKMELPTDYESFYEKYINEDNARMLVEHLRHITFDKSEIRKLNEDSTRFLIFENHVYKSQTDDYDKYRNFCFKNGFKPYNSDNFTRVLKLIDDMTLIKNEDGTIISSIIDDGELPF